MTGRSMPLAASTIAALANTIFDPNQLGERRETRPTHAGGGDKLLHLARRRGPRTRACPRALTLLMVPPGGNPPRPPPLGVPAAPAVGHLKSTTRCAGASLILI